MNPIFQWGTIFRGFLILKLVFMTSSLCRWLSFFYVFSNSLMYLINISSVHLDNHQSHQKDTYVPQVKLSPALAPLGPRDSI